MVKSPSLTMYSLIPGCTESLKNFCVILSYTGICVELEESWVQVGGSYILHIIVKAINTTDTSEGNRPGDVSCRVPYSCIDREEIDYSPVRYTEIMII